MARRAKNSKLDSSTARDKLERRGKPHYHNVKSGIHLGYRRDKSDVGKWVMRYMLDGAYVVETLDQLPDDVEDANGKTILDFDQACDFVRTTATNRQNPNASKRVGPYTVSDALDDYLEERTEKGKSVSDSKNRIEVLIKPVLGKIVAEKLTADQIKKWHRDLAKQPTRRRTRKGEEQKFGTVPNDEEAIRRRRATSNRTLTVLKAALNHAFKDSKLSSDVAWRRVEPFEAVEVARIRYLTTKESKALIDACEGDFKNLVIAALQTGARYSELARLVVSDFNPDTGTLSIAKSKSGKSRHIVLPDEGVTFFKSLTDGKHARDILLSKAGEGTWKDSHQMRPIAEACERAKITPAISFHILRHTWASLAVMNGVPLLVVAKNLGHADTRMVEKHYGHMSKDHFADAIRTGAPTFGVNA
ncbi:tyrosine-type recombinase/integrase [Phyllobacterium endophyticum]|uniref:Site-specific integrase n=1 Tax=Phyllobacterium endophyticum TaxID=1149773 RepID=A0A2P7AUV6_9HYPH|nr:site-specific integrase [Phyllobacterium endophyticum]MBB3234524.1 integrase [Phyllobacterium endophyticum]PSH58010.1 site-specific integrase [Phyllobacterium endophyticum]TYR38678.1 site-specific integrase [Phyllobacterium endophyticum]